MIKKYITYIMLSLLYDDIYQLFENRQRYSDIEVLHMFKMLEATLDKALTKHDIDDIGIVRERMRWEKKFLLDYRGDKRKSYMYKYRCLSLKYSVKSSKLRYQITHSRIDCLSYELNTILYQRAKKHLI